MENKDLNAEYVAEVRSIIGGWIREQRKKKGLTLKMCADILNISEPTMSKIENGKWMSLEILIKVCVKLDMFLFLLEKDNPNDLAETMRNMWGKMHLN